MKPYYEHAGITIYHGDCCDVMDLWEGLRTKSFDLLLTDPPYGIDAARHRHSESNGWRDYGTSDEREWDSKPVNPETLIRARNVSKRAVIWGGNYFDLPPRMGWLVWDKGQRDFSLADGELAWTSENRALRIFSYHRSKALSDGRDHPTQKPLQLMTWTLSQFPGSMSIFDPFMGTGTSLVAAKLFSKRATGIEINERYCEIAAKRLSQEALPLEMPA